MFFKSGYLPFNRAMQTFGIDESVPDEYLLSSRLAAFQGQEQSQHDTHLIPVSYVSGYTSDGFMAIPEKKLAPGYLSIEGAELLQQSWVVWHTKQKQFTATYLLTLFDQKFNPSLCHLILLFFGKS